MGEGGVYLDWVGEGSIEVLGGRDQAAREGGGLGTKSPKTEPRGLGLVHKWWGCQYYVEGHLFVLGDVNL